MGPIGPGWNCCRNANYHGREPIATEVHGYLHALAGTAVICHFQVLDDDEEVHTFQEHPHKTGQEEVLQCPSYDRAQDLKWKSKAPFCQYSVLDSCTALDQRVSAYPSRMCQNTLLYVLSIPIKKMRSAKKRHKLSCRWMKVLLFWTERQKRKVTMDRKRQMSEMMSPM